MGRKILALSLVLVMALTFVACDGEPLPPAQEIVDGAVQALDDIQAYEFEVTMSADINGEAEGEVLEGTSAVDFGGVADLENGRMQMHTSLSATTTGEGTADVEIEAYFIGDTLYMMASIPESEPAWTKMEMPTGYWEQVDQIKPYIEILEVSQVEVIGSEKVGGVDCYVLELIPDAEQLWQILIQQQATVLGMPSTPDRGVAEQTFHSCTTKQWLAKDTYFLMKVEVEIESTATATNPDAPEQTAEMNTAMALTILLYNYNQPASIELPPEAEEATEMPLDF